MHSFSSQVLKMAQGNLFLQIPIMVLIDLIIILDK